MLAFLKNLTAAQKIGLWIALLGVLNASTAQLTELIGASATHLLVSFISIASGMLGVLLSVVTSAGQQFLNVKGMQGVELMQVNAKADPQLAALAMDPNEPKVEAAPGTQRAVAATAAAAAP